jgi:hypothetical protein
MEYRLNQDLLLKHLAQWNSFLKRKVHCIACGGTAMTLLGVKASTRDIDFMLPEMTEYKYLIQILGQLGYVNVSGYGWARKGEPFIFDLFPGKKLFTTELLEDPLQKGRHVLIKEFSHIYLGVLNDHDLIVSKLFRGDAVDFDDAVTLAVAHQRELNITKLREHFFEMLSYHPVGEKRVRPHWETFEKRLKEAMSHGQ